MEITNTIATGAQEPLGGLKPSGAATTTHQSAPSQGVKAIQEEVDKAQEEQEVEELQQELQEVVSDLNREMSRLNTNVKFGFNDDIREMFVTVMEKGTDKVIRRIPSDEAMELIAKMREIIGIIFDKKG